MASGLSAFGINFDDLFDQDVMGDGPVANGLSSAGAAVRYARLAYGAKRADVGVQVGGSDVSNLWAAKGTAAYVGDGGLPALLRDSVPAIAGQVGTVFVDFSFDRGGIVRWTAYPSGNGVWAPGGGTVGDSYDARFTRISGAAVNGATGLWQQINAERLVRLLVSAPAPGAAVEAYSVVRIEIRRRADSAVLVNRTIDLSVAVVEGG